MTLMNIADIWEAWYMQAIAWAGESLKSLQILSKKEIYWLDT